MAFTTVESVASFSTVLAEAFASIGFATVAPSAAVTLAKVLKGAAQAGAGDVAPTPAPAPAGGASTLAAPVAATGIGASLAAARLSATAALADAAAAAALRAAFEELLAEGLLKQLQIDATPNANAQVRELQRQEIRAAVAAAVEAANEAHAAARLAGEAHAKMALSSQLLPKMRAALQDLFGAYGNAGKSLARFLDQAAGALDELHLMVPKTAKLHAEFEFQGSESLAIGTTSSVNVLQVVSVNSGFTALYETSSKNRITLDVEFELAKFPI